ncbi:MAG: NAD(P)H-hydrate dehydratase [Boseongicola sp.]|nr:NAD(P)H-hydrate dehydratase [Boseongicola sp.]
MEPTEITATSLDRAALAKSPEAHKYGHGHALVLTGGPGKTGAARLAARGALRMGAGLVTLGCPHPALFEVAAQTTAIMCRPLDGAPGLTEALDDARLNALCLGPGLGLGPDTQALVFAALNAGRATVLDADALTRFQNKPEILFAALHRGCLLTPHHGEFARLFPDFAETLSSVGPEASVRAAAARAGCTVLLKGAETHISDETGQSFVVRTTGENAAPWLATAGSGDVLAGFATGLMARGMPPLKAAGTAAWLHSAAARRFGPGLIAEDLPETLPKVFADLGL